MALTLDDITCSFCSKSAQDEMTLIEPKRARVIIAGPLVYICEECVGLCVDLLCEKHATGELVQIEPNVARAGYTQRALQAFEQADWRMRELKRALQRITSDLEIESKSFATKAKELITRLEAASLPTEPKEF